MSEFRVPGQAEPISHFTDAVQAGDLLFVSGVVPVDENRELVGGDDVVAQARAVFANMGAMLAAAGCTFADVVKVTLFLTDIDDRPLVNPVRQEVFGELATRLDARRGLGARDPRCADRGRGRRAGPVVSAIADDRWNAGHHLARRAAAASAPAGRSPGRTLLVKDLIDTAGIRTTYGSRIYADHVPERHAPVVDRALDAGATILGKANLVEFAWGVLGANRVLRQRPQPGSPGPHDRGLVERQRRGDRGGPLRPRDRHGHRMLGAACLQRRASSSASSRGSAPIPTDGVYPLCPSFDTVGPMARTVGEAAALWSVLSGRPIPEPRLDGLAVGLLRRAPSLGDGRETEPSDAADEWAGRLEALGARVVEAEIPGPSADTWPVFQHEAARSHAATFPSRADEYGSGIRVKLDGAQRVDPEAVDEGYRALLAWRRLVPEVDLFVCPCVAIDWPAEDATSSTCAYPSRRSCAG